MFYGREKAWGEPEWKRRMGYYLLGELHVPGRLRSWHIIEELRRLGAWNPAPRRLLDAGGGEGAFSYHVARRFPSWKVTVADNEPETIARGERIKDGLGLRNVEIRAVDLREPLGEQRYDLVLCSDVLEHIEEDTAVMKNLGDVLEPGGYLVLTSPSVPQPRHLPIVAWRERRIGFDPADYGHVRQGYSRDGVVRLMDAAGLEVERVRWTFGLFGTLMFDLFFATGDSKPNPAAYAVLFPFYLTLSALDLRVPIRHGAAILGVGRKP